MEGTRGGKALRDDDSEEDEDEELELAREERYQAGVRGALPLPPFPPLVRF